MCSAIDVHIGLAQLSSTRLAFTGVDGAAFTNTTLTYQLSKNVGNGYQTLGSTTSAGSLTSNAESITLDSFFSSIPLTPMPGTNYHVEVDEGNTALGTADFTVVH